MEEVNYRNKWLNIIFLNTVITSIVIYFWLPLLFTLPPGEDYRHMIGSLSFLAILVGIIMFIQLAITDKSKGRCRKTKISGIIFSFIPLIVQIIIIHLLAMRGNLPSP